MLEIREKHDEIFSHLGWHQKSWRHENWSFNFEKCLGSEKQSLMQQHATMHASTIIEFEIDQKSTFIPLLSFEDDVKHDHYSYCIKEYLLNNHLGNCWGKCNLR